MPYCLSIHTNAGLVLCSASNPLSDHTMQSNMHRFVWPGDRFITILCSGNLQTTTAVMDRVNADLANNSPQNLLTMRSLNETTDYIASLSTQVQKRLKKTSGSSQNFEANFIVAGQIEYQAMETSLIYAQGNYIHEPNSSPFLQIGEIKFGKPILDRIVNRDISLERAARCALVSMDSTMRSTTDTITPIELLFYNRDSLEMSAYLSLDEHHPLLKNISQSWANDIINALDSLPNFYWEI